MHQRRHELTFPKEKPEHRGILAWRVLKAIHQLAALVDSPEGQQMLTNLAASRRLH